MTNSATHKRSGTKEWWKQVNYDIKPTSQTREETCFDVNKLNAYYNNNSTTDRPSEIKSLETASYEVPVVAEYQVFNYLRKIKQTATGLDGIPYWILRDSALYLVSPVAHIFNLSLSSAKFPTQWKLSCIKPVPKCSNPVSFEDMRPISLTPILARVFRRLVYDIYSAGVYSSTLNVNQFGFRKHASTTCALVNDLLNDIYIMRRSTDYIRVITLDMSKAFDTVSHSSIVSGLCALQPNLNPYITNWYVDFIKKEPTTLHSTRTNRPSDVPTKECPKELSAHRSCIIPHAMR